MIDLPPDLPEPVSPATSLVYECANYAGEHYNVSPYIILSIISVEGGKIGSINVNSNKSYDLGVMQINTINLEDIKMKFPKVTWESLAYEPCVNIGVGTWLLSNRIKEAGNLWTGVGNYHSKTPRYHQRYLSKVYPAYKAVIKKYLGASVVKSGK